MNKNIFTITILIIILLIGGASTYKVIKRHNDRLMLVSEKLITERARLCYEEKKCTENMVTLKTLYNLNYLETQANPVTKEYYNEESYIKKEDDLYTFVEVN